jgi:cytochrome b subunit of formate dehydrogenase
MRLLHWSLAAAYVGLLSSGLALQNADLRGIPLLGSRLVREVHLTWALLLVLAPALAASWDGYREPGRVWASDRLSLGQRANTLLVVGLLVALALTGTLVAADRALVPQAWREVAYESHRRLAYATLPLIAGHVVLALRSLITGAYTGTTKGGLLR